ncbi:MAG TPA: hypothetical protein VKR58_11845 [Aquella sp.]|nr:hypothetical protein [Aquella sp.]
MIKSNPQLKANLLKTVGDSLRKYIPSASNLVFTTDGTNLIIKFTLEELLTKVPPKEGQLQVYANIASNLSIDKLNDLCRTNKEFRDVCKDPVFWITLFRERFPGKYKGPKDIGIPEKKRDWEQIYKAAVEYSNKDAEIQRLINNERIIPTIPPMTLSFRPYQYIDKDTPENQYWRGVVRRYPKSLLYLLENNIFPFSQEDIDKILTFSEDLQLTSYILNNYVITQKVLDAAWTYNKNGEVHDLIVNYRGVDAAGNPVQIKYTIVEPDAYGNLIL